MAVFASQYSYNIRVSREILAQLRLAGEVVPLVQKVLQLQVVQIHALLGGSHFVSGITTAVHTSVRARTVYMIQGALQKGQRCRSPSVAHRFTIIHAYFTRPWYGGDTTSTGLRVRLAAAYHMLQRVRAFLAAYVQQY